MLRDAPIRRKGTDRPRRWMSDDYFDLIVWYENDASVYGFQLCYDKLERERALTWTRDKGFNHRLVDGGEEAPMRNRSPMLGAAVPVDCDALSREFLARSEKLSASIRTLVLDKLRSLSSIERPL